MIETSQTWLSFIMMVASLFLLLVVAVLLQRRQLSQARDRLHDLQKQLEERLQQAERDPGSAREEETIGGLTGIVGQRAFGEHLKLQWRRTARSRLPLTVLLIEVDGFHGCDDSTSGSEGDRFLSEISTAVSNQLKRPGDMVARFDDDKFAVLLAETDASGGVAVAEKMRRTVEDLGLAGGPEAHRGTVTVSIGVATTVPISQEQPSSLLASADRALTVAQQHGGNRVEA